MNIINTENLKILACNTQILQAAIEGNEILARKLNCSVPEDWTEFGVGALQYSLAKLSEEDTETGWWTYLPVHIQDNKLIGSGGYKGKPTNEGIVEIGYEITPEYRNRGFATEMTKGLIENAFTHENVKIILAHTLGHENPSTKVLQKCGFEKIEEIMDEEDGLIWKWQLVRR